MRFIGIALLIVFQASHHGSAAEFASTFDNTYDRIWIGEDYWANPMEDWRIENGRLECVRGGENRNIHLLTGELTKEKGEFNMSVRIGRIDKGKRKGSAGFAIGVRDRETSDYRSNLLFGDGLAAGVTSEGQLFIGSPNDALTDAKVESIDDVVLRVNVVPKDDSYTVTLFAHDSSGKQMAKVVRRKVNSDQLAGNLALVNNHAANRRPHVAGKGPLARFSFSEWKISGSKFVRHEDRDFGPILYAMHSLSRGVMKMTAQMPPLGGDHSNVVDLQTKKDGDWKTVDQQPIDKLSRTATFRIKNWNDDQDVEYQLVYVMKDRDGKHHEHYYQGTVRKDPVGKEEVVIAGFTGNTDPGFPNNLVARNVGIMDPDVLFFSGDQIYEGVGGYGIFREPVDSVTLNYLRKIWLWGWAFRDLMRDRPTLVLPDDHDVYQGNIWGQNGRDSDGIANHAKGGYAMPAEWVNAVQRTQTAHHPDPYDPMPIEQDITVFYGDMVYGRISFAVLEDRKFKSGPEGKVNSWKGRPDHVKDPKLDPKSLDKPNLKLLGDRQLKFLREWSGDWKGADLKIAVSQTIFCNLANYHGGNQEHLVADLDSNGWPQAGRNRALDELRRGFAFHYAGDQHLASIVHHGIETWRDAGFSFCVPSIAAGYPRSWRADAEGRPVKNRPEPGLPNTGDYVDGLGNHVSVFAIGNPAEKNRRGRINTLHDKASGFGIVRLNKPTGAIKIECYRLQIDANNLKDSDQFPGWPRTIDYKDNYGRKAVAHLPEIEIIGVKNPVVQVVNEKNDEVVYTLRIRGGKFLPKVFDDKATYTVRVGEPDIDTMQTRKGVKPDAEDSMKFEF